MKGRRMALVLVVVLIAAGAALAGFRLAGQAPGREARPEPEEGPLLALGEILTNLADEGRGRYIQVAIQLELDSEQTLRHLEERLPVLRNEVIALLRATPAGEIQGDEGMRRLAARIAERINAGLHEGKVLRVYFTAFVVQ